MARKLTFAPLLLICPLLVPLHADEQGSSRRTGKYEVTLRLPPDGLYAAEEVEIEMRIEDWTRVDPVLGPAAVIRARVEAAIDMPVMPAMPVYLEIAHPEDIPGVYGVHPTFAHAGDYRLRLSVAPGADEPFQVEFPLRVLDAEGAQRHKPHPASFQMELLSTPKTPKAGAEAELQFIIRARENPRKIFASFEPLHEKLLHLVIVRADLGQFAHVHPELGADGVFRIRYIFPSGGEYHLFAEAAPRRAGAQMMMAKLRVAGHISGQFEIAAAARPRVDRIGGVEIELKSPPDPVPVHKLIGLNFSLRDSATGAPIRDLEPYVGAMGHLILIHQDGVTLIHSHPDERLPDLGRNGTVPFLARFPKPGLYRAWCQFQRHGAVLTGEFIVEAGGGVE